MIDLEAEQAITLTAAAKTCPGRPHISTVWRWAETGVRGVRLDTIAIGGRRYTTREAIQRFIAATTAASVAPQATPPRTPAARQRAVARARAELAKAGI